MSRETVVPQADFSEMTPGGELFVSDGIHGATMSVGEVGPEAVAAAAGVMPPLAIAEDMGCISGRTGNRQCRRGNVNGRSRPLSNSRDVGIELTGTRVLLVSDDLDMGRIWVYALSQTGLEVTLARTVDDSLSLWGDGAYDLAVIDFRDSHQKGISLCRQLRAEAVNPIVLLTPRGDEDRVMEAYLAGVDECVVKPISPCLLLAKLRVWLRRSWTVPARALDRFQVDGLCLDPVRREVVITGGTAAKLTNLEFRLLHLLMSHRGQVLRSDLILDRVWGYFGGGDCAMLKNLVYRLRRKIEPDPSQPTYIQTVTGEGYTFLPN